MPSGHNRLWVQWRLDSENFQSSKSGFFGQRMSHFFPTAAAVHALHVARKTPNAPDVCAQRHRHGGVLLFVFDPCLDIDQASLERSDVDDRAEITERLPEKLVEVFEERLGGGTCLAEFKVHELDEKAAGADCVCRIVSVSDVRPEGGTDDHVVEMHVSVRKAACHVRVQQRAHHLMQAALQRIDRRRAPSRAPASSRRCLDRSAGGCLRNENSKSTSGCWPWRRRLSTGPRMYSTRRTGPLRHPRSSRRPFAAGERRPPGSFCASCLALCPDG